MLVPLVDAASISPVNRPLLIDTVPETRVVLPPGSLTVVPDDSVVAVAPAA
jgi:hypothetical protein